MAENQDPWIPLESNPTILTQYLWELGISKDLEFYDVLTLDDQEILRFIPRPVYSLLFVFPVEKLDNSDTIETLKRPSTENQGNILWYPQTIKNTCGAIALLHAATNGGAKEYILPNSLLENILKEMENLSPISRSKVIESSSQLKAIHSKFASQGTTMPPDAFEDIDLHYICLTKSLKDDHLYELDGRNPSGPIDHGFLNDSDLLGNQSVQIVKNYIQQRKKKNQFSII